MIEGVELTWYDDEGYNGCIDLEPYQVFAIFQILGLQVQADGDGYIIKHFSEKTVMERLKKAGILVEKEQN